MDTAVPSLPVNLAGARPGFPASPPARPAPAERARPSAERGADADLERDPYGSRTAADPRHHGSSRSRRADLNEHRSPRPEPDPVQPSPAGARLAAVYGAEALTSMIHRMGGAALPSAKGTYVDVRV